MTRDIHHHVIPEALKRRLDDLPAWSVEKSLDYMDANAISVASLSLSNYDIAFDSDDDYTGFCRSVNDELAALTEQRPDRLEWFATLPFPLVNECVNEIARCRAAGAAGYVLYTNVNGVYPSMVDHAALFAAVESTGLPIFLHPGSTPRDGGPRAEAFSEYIEYPQEVTRLVCRFLVEDGFRTFPKLSLILSHGGGTFPYQFARVGKLPYMKTVGDSLKIRWGRIIGDMARKKTQIEDYVERMVFDLYDADAPEQRAALAAVVGKDRLVYGSNFPYQGA